MGWNNLEASVSLNERMSNVVVLYRSKESHFYSINDVSMTWRLIKAHAASNQNKKNYEKLSDFCVTDKRVNFLYVRGRFNLDHGYMNIDFQLNPFKLYTDIENCLL